MVRCPHCKGSGTVEPYPTTPRVAHPDTGELILADRCLTCSGAGSIAERSAIKYKIGQAERAGRAKDAAAGYAELAAFDAGQGKAGPGTAPPAKTTNTEAGTD